MSDLERYPSSTAHTEAYRIILLPISVVLFHSLPKDYKKPKESRWMQILSFCNVGTHGINIVDDKYLVDRLMKFPKTLKDMPFALIKKIQPKLII